MTPHLVPASPLSQVVFIHDYLQLVFGDECFTIYNRAMLKTAAGEVVYGLEGFEQGVLGLVGSRVVHCDTEPTLRLRFENGAEMVVLKGVADVYGPEAFRYSRSGGVCVVDQNAV